MQSFLIMHSIEKAKANSFTKQNDEGGCKGVRITQGKAFCKKPSRKSGGGSFKRRSIRLQQRNTTAATGGDASTAAKSVVAGTAAVSSTKHQRSIGNRDSDAECKFVILIYFEDADMWWSPCAAKGVDENLASSTSSYTMKIISSYVTCYIRPCHGQNCP